MSISRVSRTLSLLPSGRDYKDGFYVDVLTAMMVSDEIAATGVDYKDVSLDDKFELAKKIMPDLDDTISNIHCSLVPCDLFLRFGDELGLIRPFGGPYGNGSERDGAESNYPQCNIFFSLDDNIPFSFKEEAIGALTVEATPLICNAGRKLYETQDDAYSANLFSQLIKIEVPNSMLFLKNEVKDDFCVKPFLELTRLIQDMDGLSREEMMIYGLQLTHYKKLDLVKSKIANFRNELASRKGHYDEYVDECFFNEMAPLYKDEIEQEAKRPKTIKGTKEKVLLPFEEVQAGFLNRLGARMRGFTEVFYRLLRYTRMFISDGYVIKVDPRFTADIDIYLQRSQEEQIAHGFDTTVFLIPGKVTDQRGPQYIDHRAYEYLTMLRRFNVGLLEKRGFDSDEDLRNPLREFIAKSFKLPLRSLEKLDTRELHAKRLQLIEESNKANDAKLELKLPEGKSYKSIIDTYKDILEDRLFDCPLYAVWNTKRAMYMIGNGSISSNIIEDSANFPISSKGDRLPHIDCVYEGFSLSIGAIVRTGFKQFGPDGLSYNHFFECFAAQESNKDKPCFGLYLIPSINNKTLEHCRIYNKQLRESKLKLIPMSIIHFMQLLMNVKNSKYKPTANDLQLLFEECVSSLARSMNLKEWNYEMQQICNRFLAEQNSHKEWPITLTANLRKGRPKR